MTADTSARCGVSRVGVADAMLSASAAESDYLNPYLPGRPFGQETGLLCDDDSDCYEPRARKGGGPQRALRGPLAGLIRPTTATEIVGPGSQIRPP